MANFRLGPPPERFYKPDMLGGYCSVCGRAMPAALAGMLEHPTCDGDFAPLLAASKRARARIEAAEKPAETPPQTGHDRVE